MADVGTLRCLGCGVDDRPMTGLRVWSDDQGGQTMRMVYACGSCGNAIAPCEEEDDALPAAKAPQSLPRPMGAPMVFVPQAAAPAPIVSSAPVNVKKIVRERIRFIRAELRAMARLEAELRELEQFERVTATPAANVLPLRARR